MSLISRYDPNTMDILRIVQTDTTHLNVQSQAQLI